MFHKYRLFFNTHRHGETRFLYDMAFGLMPFRFEDSLIYDEEEEVREMYFIQEGVVGIGYYAYQQGLSSGVNCLKLGVFIHEGAFICDYYICCHKKSQFVYVATKGPKQVSGFALKRSFLHKEIFAKYPDEASDMKSQALLRYRENVRKRLLQHREEHLKEQNKKSTYKTVEVAEKPQDLVDAEVSDTVDLASILKQRMVEVQSELTRLRSNLG